MRRSGRWRCRADRRHGSPGTRIAAALSSPEGLAAGESEAMLDNLLESPDGAAEVRVLADLHRRDPHLRREIETLVIGPDEAQRLRGLAARELRAAGRPEAGAARHARLRPAVAAAAGFFFVATAIFILRGKPAGDTARAGPNAAVSTLAPRGRIGREAAVFRWTAVKGAREYRLEIFDSGLRPVYARVLETEVCVPSREGFLSFETGAVYFWKVTARLGNGETLESDFETFRISGR